MTDTTFAPAAAPVPQISGAGAGALAWDGDRASIAKAFVSAQKAMEAVKKAASNPHFKTKYADLSEVVESVVPALNDAGIGVIQAPAFDGKWVTITTTFLHESGASLSGTLQMLPSKTDPQGVGSAITYGRRYSLLAMTGAAPEDDDGNASSGPRQQHQQQQQTDRIPTLSERADTFVTALNGANSLADLDKAWAKGSKVCADLDAKDPEKLARIEAHYKARQDELTAANPFAEAA